MNIFKHFTLSVLEWLILETKSIFTIISIHLTTIYSGKFPMDCIMKTEDGARQIISCPSYQQVILFIISGLPCLFSVYFLLISAFRTSRFFDKVFRNLEWMGSKHKWLHSDSISNNFLSFCFWTSINKLTLS